MTTTMNRFLSVHSMSFVTCNMMHMTNWIVNGLPERFPKLKVIWIESGLAWVPFMMQRLDHEYLMRQSDAPLLKRLPSEYIAEMFFTSQPLEVTMPHMLEATFKAVHAETQLMYSSDWPHWDFDVPARIAGLPFLSEQAKRNILGDNARRVFQALASIRIQFQNCSRIPIRKKILRGESTIMHKVLALYPQPKDPAHFKKYYEEKHLPLAAQMPGLISSRYTFAVEGVGAPSPYFCIWEGEFADAAAMGAAMQSPIGQKVAADVANYATGGSRSCTLTRKRCRRRRPRRIRKRTSPQECRSGETCSARRFPIRLWTPPRISRGRCRKWSRAIVSVKFGPGPCSIAGRAAC